MIMKKRIIALCVMGIMVCTTLIGCGNGNANTTEEDTDFIDSSIEEVSSEQSLEPETVETVSTTFECTSAELAKALFDEEIECYTNVVSGYTIDTYRKDRMYAYIVTAPDEDFPGLVYIYDPTAGISIENSMSVLSNLISPNINTDDIISGKYELEDGYTTVAYICKEKSDAVNFNMQILQPENDFILSLGVDTYNDMIAKGQYYELYTYASEYIASNTPSTYDNAYWIKDCLEPIMSDWDDITVEYDEFDGYATFYYKDVKQIDSSTHFVPYGSSNSSGIKILMGFYASDWIFFDRIKISCGSEIIQFGPFSGKIEEVMSGGTIYECIDMTEYAISGDSDETINEITSTEEHIIRFINDDTDEYYDFSMSKNEVDALRIINDLGEAYSDLKFISTRFK